MAKNIEINYNTGNGYEQLWPKTLLGNVPDWNSSIYSKTEINNLLSKKGNLKFFSGTRKGTGMGKPSIGQLLYSIQTGGNLIFFAMCNDGMIDGINYRPVDKEVYPYYTNWMFWCNTESNTGTLGFTININIKMWIEFNKKENSIDFKFDGINGADDLSNWPTVLLDNTRYTYRWWGIGIDNN